MNVQCNIKTSSEQNADADNTLQLWESDMVGAAIKEYMHILYEESKEEIYKDSSLYVSKLYHFIKSENFSLTLSKEEKKVDYNELCMNMPFYMFYETNYNQKEKYNEIVRRFLTLREDYFDEDNHLYSVKNKGEGTIENTAKVMFAIILVLENTSEEIYEVYRTLIDLFRESLHGVLTFLDGDTIGSSGALWNNIDYSVGKMLDFAVKNAIRIGIIQEEKYTGLNFSKEDVCQEGQ